MGEIEQWYDRIVRQYNLGFTGEAKLDYMQLSKKQKEEFLNIYCKNKKEDHIRFKFANT